MRFVYLRPVLSDLSQGARISFVRQFRFMTQDELSSKLGLTGENKRRSICRYETGERNPKEERVKKIAKILNVNFNAIKKYDYKSNEDIIYTLMWLEELLPNLHVDLIKNKILSNKELENLENGINKWMKMKSKRDLRQITYKEYINWKLNFDLEENI